MKNNYTKEKSKGLYSLFNRLLIISSIFFILIYTGCKKENAISDEINVTNLKPDTDLFNALVKIGFEKESIKDTGGYYEVEGDLLFVKFKTDINFLNDFYAIKTSDLLNKKMTVDKYGQWQTPSIVSTIKSENIRVFINIGSWSNEVVSALQNWAAINNSKINFHQVFDSSDADIVVRADDGILQNSTIAQAQFPSSGNPGFQILINTDFNNSYAVPSSTKLYNMAHEIGHCIGLRHSNWQSIGEPSQGTIQIPNTPQSDANSVMNGFVFLEWFF